MELNELLELAAVVEQAKLAELQAQRELINAEESLNAIKSLALAGAYRDGIINGKNAEARKRQETAFLVVNKTYLDTALEVSDTKRDADIAVAKLAGIETRAGLVKAWLYSQAKFA